MRTYTEGPHCSSLRVNLVYICQTPCKGIRSDLASKFVAMIGSLTPSSCHLGASVRFALKSGFLQGDECLGHTKQTNHNASDGWRDTEQVGNGSRVEQLVLFRSEVAATN